MTQINRDTFDADTSRLHSEAMAAVDLGDSYKRMGKLAIAAGHYRRAFALERSAAIGFLDLKDVEPTRSVLFRSAAWLAFQCGELQEGARLARFGLSGMPPPEIRRELEEVLAQISKDGAR